MQRFPNKMYVSQRSTFRGPVMLSYILKRNVGLKILIQCDIKFDLHTRVYVGHWPIFCGRMILPYIFMTIWWTSLILWILVLIWAIDLYFMIKWFWISYLFLSTVVCWSLICTYLWIYHHYFLSFHHITTKHHGNFISITVNVICKQVVGWLSVPLV